MNDTPAEQKRRRPYVKHGDYSRAEQERARRMRAIDGRTFAGRLAKRWRRYAIEQKGGKQCPLDVLMKIEVATFKLWRGLALAFLIIEDSRTRGSVINRRTRRLPVINQQADALLEQWQRINDSLELDRKGAGLDLAQLLAQKAQAGEQD
jgi:hypothetical protein